MITIIYLKKGWLYLSTTTKQLKHINQGQWWNEILVLLHTHLHYLLILHPMQYAQNELTILSALCHPSENVKIHGKCETYIYLADSVKLSENVLVKIISLYLYITDYILKLSFSLECMV